MTIQSGPPRLLSAAEVIARTSLSRATIWRRTRNEGFPAPVHLGGNRIAWREAEVNAWIEDRTALSEGAVT